MLRLNLRSLVPAVGVVMLLSAIAGQDALAQRPSTQHQQHRGSGKHPVYQRHSTHWNHRRDDRHRHALHHRVPPQTSAGWFQRPYPYHLDYYKMRYGGSYAPYFGNLYGPPQIVTAPPYYGPYYGDFGYGAPNGFAQPVPLDAMPREVPPEATSELPAP